MNYDSCATAVDELQRAALPHVGAYGFGDPLPVEAGGVPEGRERTAAPAEDAEASAAEPSDGQSGDEHSKTNTHESGVDEPDLVKTDGDRLITVADGTLRVIDVASKEMVATLAMPEGGEASQLLVHGDRALVLLDRPQLTLERELSPKPRPDGFQSRLVLVDLADGAKVLGTLAVDGAYLDARQVGSVARIVVRSHPHLSFVYPTGSLSNDDSLRQNKKIVRDSSISDWLPRYELTRGEERETGQLVECGSVSRPKRFSGTAMLTVLTIDVERELGLGDPVSIVADGDTVYGTAASLYVADDHQPHVITDGGPGIRPEANEPRTEVYQFDISRPGKPAYVASGVVDGVLLNQYSLSEYGGNLRVATTVGDSVCCDRRSKSESMVTVLTRRGDSLVKLGRVDGLGVGERIYAVRFFDDVGYVVTFRQTDPLYTLDLSDPRHPRVVGELKITGYSAYLHSAGEGRLIGVGQEATIRGQTTGTQVSLFDTSNAANPHRLAQYQLPGAYSEVEVDPHAFLYWPDTGLLAIPVSNVGSSVDGRSLPGGALVLRLTGGKLTEAGMISHPGGESVRRTLVIGQELWTVSRGGVRVDDLEQLTKLSWIPFA